MIPLQTAIQNIQNVPMMSETAQVILVILPIVSVVVLGILAFFFMLWDHKKKMLMIQNGRDPVPRKIYDKLFLLGIVSFFIGTVLTVFSAIRHGFTNSLLGGMIPTATGIGIIIYYIVIERKQN